MNKEQKALRDALVRPFDQARKTWDAVPGLEPKPQPATKEKKNIKKEEANA